MKKLLILLYLIIVLIIVGEKNWLVEDYISKVLKKYDVYQEKIKNYEIQNICNIDNFYFKYFINHKIYDNKKYIRTLPENIFPFCKNIFSKKIY